MALVSGKVSFIAVCELNEQRASVNDLISDLASKPASFVSASIMGNAVIPKSLQPSRSSCLKVFRLGIGEAMKREHLNHLKEQLLFLDSS